MSVVGRDIPHDSATLHVTGQSVFIDDMPRQPREVFVEIVGAPCACGTLRSVDTSLAAGVAGVVAIFTARDIPGHNKFGPVVHDEHLLVNDEVHFLGDPVALVVAVTREAALAARKLVKVDVEPRKPILSIDDAIAAKSFMGAKRTISCGDVDAAMHGAKHKLEGVFEIGGQDHFYLESQATIAVPGEGGQMVVHSSTQHPSEVQAVVAEVIGVPFNHVTVICKRMGGGFGGKETQAAQPAAMAALVAHLLKRPARVVFSKDDDMRITGKRHPFKSWYKVGFDDSGMIQALSIDHYSDGGCTTDLSFAVLERAMLHTDNAYFLPNARITGQVCRTNYPSNTAFRGFGGPQGVANIENIIEAIAQKLNVDALDVRRRNCYGTDHRNVAPYGQLICNNTLPEIFSQLETSANYRERRSEIDVFNRLSATHVRGLSMTAVKFGISFTRRTLNQANALVNIYLDGTIMVSTGATEMGQGVNTRVRQLVADDLGVGFNSVIVAATSTDRNNNTSPTAASSGTDLNGAAALDACARLKARIAEVVATKLFSDPHAGLAPEPSMVRFADDHVFDARRPDMRITFRQAVQTAYDQRVSLGERGFYATPGVDFNRETGKGTPFLYYTNGAACSEVLIDRLTGEMKVVRVDLLMDAGRCINPGLDRGQITGGFIQGMGWVTAEELRYSDSGELLSHSPTTYKIPNIGDVPDVFNVSLLDNPHSTMSLKGSKALGEPPLLLGVSVFTACRNALSYLCGEDQVTLSLPATGEKLLMAMTRFEQNDGSGAGGAATESEQSSQPSPTSSLPRGRAGHPSAASPSQPGD